MWAAVTISIHIIRASSESHTVKVGFATEVDDSAAGSSARTTAAASAAVAPIVKRIVIACCRGKAEVLGGELEVR